VTVSAMSDIPSPNASQPEPQKRWLLEVVRYALPAVVALAGIVVMCLGGESDLEGGAGILSAGLAIYFINWLFRMGAAGDSERAAEQSAREYFSAHGHWPGEGPSQPVAAGERQDTSASPRPAPRRPSPLRDPRRQRRR
jgi:hypothetical protein